MKEMHLFSRISNNNSRAEFQWTGAEKNTYFIVNNLSGETTEFVENLNGSLSVSFGKLHGLFQQRRWQLVRL